MQKQYECFHCDAIFKIKHSLEEETYQVYFCPFCGGDIEDEIEDDTDEE